MSVSQENMELLSFDSTEEEEISESVINELSTNFAIFQGFTDDTSSLHKISKFVVFDKDAPMKINEANKHPHEIVRREIPKRRIAVHETVQQKLDAFYESKKIPHIIFHGASGTGKLTLVNDFIRRIYQGDKQRIKTNVMTVNCSHGKGIRFIRDELKFFAKTNIPTNSGVLFKTILLINAHHLTIDAQSALRRCIELFSYNTRFFIVLENKNKLLNPILSRFCEIYIPEYTDSDNRIINLHQYSLSQTYDVSSSKDKIREYIDSVLKQAGYMNKEDTVAGFAKYSGERSSLEFRERTLNTSQIVEDFYVRGISCLDIMEWFNTQRESWTEKQYANSIMCFHRIKTEFRCEKMLMFYMLNFIFCSTHELPIA